MKKELNFDNRIDIEKYIKLDYSGEYIASSLGFSRSGICTEIRRNGGRQKYNAQEAQKRAQRMRFRSTREWVDVCKSEKDEFKERISNIEMQIEIILETLKELMKNDKKN
jgi:IS30 family transposase